MSNASDESGERAKASQAKAEEYVTPELREFGTLDELTHGGGGGFDPGEAGPS